MKILSNIYKKTVLATAVAFGALMSSCTDYLTIIPADVLDVCIIAWWICHVV